MSSARLTSRVAWRLAAIAPVLVGALPARTAALAHPAWALILLAGYELVLLAGKFGAAVAAALAARWTDRLVEHIDLTILRWWSRTERKYRLHLIESVRFIDIKGLATVGYITPRLDDVFVDVGLTYRAPMDVPSDILTDTQIADTERFSILDLLDLPDARVLALIGGPGSGKTTLLRHTASRICRTKGRKRNIPVLLTLRDHTQRIVNDPYLSLTDLVQNILEHHGISATSNWLERRLQSGKCVVLLDGLDEVAKKEDRRLIGDWVERLTVMYPLNDFVISSRPHGYRSSPIQGATVLQVLPFTDDQIATFVNGWYLAAERHATGLDARSARTRAVQASNDLLDRLRFNSGLRALTSNPLLLTMIANVHRYRGALPGSRVDLYGEICQVVLWRRQEVKRISSEISGDKKEVILRRIAYSMMVLRVRDLPRAQILAETASALQRVSTSVDPEMFMEEMGSIGLLVEREQDLYAFAHLTFQEYLAAAQIREKGLVETLEQTVSDPWWKETTLLYAARSDADSIISACLAANTTAALSLAFDCIDQGSEIAPALRKELGALLGTAYLDNTSSQLRQLMVKLIVTRRLKESFQPQADDISRLCNAPISSDIYQLFTQDSGNPEPDCALPLVLSSTEPVRGVRSTDAAAFVAWVNEMTEGNPEYRLPRLNEPTTVSLDGNPALSVWLQSSDDGKQLTLSTPMKSLSSRIVPGDYLARQTSDDLRKSPELLTRILLIRIAAAAKGIRSAHAQQLSEGSIFPLCRMMSRDAGFLKSFTNSALSAQLSTYILGLSSELDSLSESLQALTQHLLSGRGSPRALDHAETIRIALSDEIDFSEADSYLSGLGPELEFIYDYAGEVDTEASHRIWMGLVMGTALTTASDIAFGWSIQHPDRASLFRESFLLHTGSMIREHSIVVEQVLDDLAPLHARVTALLEQNSTRMPSDWAGIVTDRLFESATRLLGRQDTFDPHRACAVRLAATSLAHELQPCGISLAEQVDTIGAAVLFMQMRRKKHLAATEGVLLAVT